jgi:aminopeptidase Y
MGIVSTLALCATIAGASALQIPFLSSHSQAPVQLSNKAKPIINSTELQDLISGDRLLTRAKKLYEIAKLGEIEYNHPTRVIGSAGMYAHVIIAEPSLIGYRSRRDACLHLRVYP